jgi:hypothetical protein
MKKLSILVVIVLLAVLAYVVAGPFLTVNAIRDAVRTDNASALSRQVDFNALRPSIKRQLRDATLRKAGDDMQSSLLGALGMAAAGSLSDLAVDAMVTPVGLGALMEGRKLWNRAYAQPPPARDTGDGSAGTPDPLQDPAYRFESHDRFTATVRADDGSETTFVLTRSGLHWKLTDIRLPL